MAVMDNSREYTNGTGLITYSGWAGTLSAAATLSFVAEVDINSANGSSICSCSYTLDGSTWSQIFSKTVTTPSQTYSVAIPSGQNLALVQVQFACRSNVIRGNQDAESDAGITVSSLQIA